VDNIKIGRRTENKKVIMQRDRIKVEGRIMVVDNIKIRRRTENKDMIMERDRIKVEGQDHGCGQYKEREEDRE
jgi:hypothetical protein